MVIAREEIFGPVLVMIGYDDIDHAVEIANDSNFGLAGYVSGADVDAVPRGRAADAHRRDLASTAASTSTRRSAATSAAATAANGASSASTNISSQGAARLRRRP